MVFKDYLKEIRDYFVNEGLTDEIKLAKEEFTKLGIDLSEGENYEERLKFFFDWYLFDRQLSNISLPPVKYFIEILAGKGIAQEAMDVYSKFPENTLSIFIVKAKGIGYVKVKDMFTRKRYIVNGDNLIGFERKDMMEARLIPFDGSYRFSEAFCFYPDDIKGMLKKEIKEAKKQGEADFYPILLKFRRLKTMSERFTRMDIKKVYILMESRLA